MNEPRAIRIAVTAMGGQGGGVLAGWIARLGERAGFIAQSTSVPGVAQRTGATIYYIELFPSAAAQAKGKAPVLALMPASGDVDIVIAAEFMEAGRAILRGIVSEQTTLIASSHRDYAIAEKIDMGDGRQSVASVRRAAMKAAGCFIEADMAAAAAVSGAVISAVLFGALAGSGALQISRDLFEATIIESGRAVAANLRGFASGFDLAANAQRSAPVSSPPSTQSASPSPAVAPLLNRMRSELPPEAHDVAREGLKRCVDYQDVAYANEYLDRLKPIFDCDNAGAGFRLTVLVARHLALWMTYEDAVRVADLKTRDARFDRFRNDVKAEDGQIVIVREYLHPRVEEVCDILPSGLSQSILAGRMRRQLLAKLLGGGRRVSTTSLTGFVQLWALSKLRPLRRQSYRFSVEKQRIDAWLRHIRDASSHDYAFACEIAALQRLLKGYGDTHARGLGNYEKILSRLDAVRSKPDPAATLAALRDAALKDEEGKALHLALDQLTQQPMAAE